MDTQKRILKAYYAATVKFGIECGLADSKVNLLKQTDVLLKKALDEGKPDEDFIQKVFDLKENIYRQSVTDIIDMELLFND